MRVVSCLVFVFFILLEKYVYAEESVDDRRGEMKVLNDRVTFQEIVLESLVSEAKSLYSERHNYVKECTCSYHTCSNEWEIPELPCYDRIRTSGYCEENCKEVIHYGKTAIRTPYGVNPNNLTSEMKESICTFKLLENKMVEILSEDKDVWTYFGTYVGHFRKWPRIPDKRSSEDGNSNIFGCVAYDPRIRPWYVGAVSGPKDFVIMIDAGIYKNLFDTLEVIEAIMETITYSDFISVIIFSDEYHVLMKEDHLIQALDKNKEALIEEIRDFFERIKIDKIKSGRFIPAFKKSFQILENSRITYVDPIWHYVAPRVTNSNKLIMLVNCGTTDESNLSILESVRELQNNLNKENFANEVVIHSVTLDSAIENSSLQRQLSCQNGGSWLHFHKNEDIRTKLNIYMSFNAIRNNVSEPYWHEPYTDFSGLGVLTTISQPVLTDYGFIIGVVGKDIILDWLSAGTISYNDTVKQLVNRSRGSRRSITVDPCHLQLLRNMVNAICVVDLPESLCYEYDGLWYEQKEDRMSWKDAYDACLEDGGNLVSAKSPEHLSFIAAMAHSDGSWIGAHYDIGSQRIKWINSDLKDIYDFYNGWFNDRIPFDANINRCITIDPSGTTQNLYTYDCNIKKTFICEYKKKPQKCHENTYMYDEYTHEVNKIPPIEQCHMDQTSFDTLNAINEVDSKRSDEVLCDMGLERSWDSVACCHCHKDDHSFISNKTLIISLTVTALALFLLFFIFFVYSLCYCLCSRKKFYNMSLFCSRISCFKCGHCFYDIFKRTDKNHNNSNNNTYSADKNTTKLDLKQIT